MSVGACVAKEKKPAPDEKPQGSEDVQLDYTQHIKVPLTFKQRLERIAQRINHQRKRDGKRKLPVGWFIVTNLEAWMSETEKEQDESQAE